MALIIIGFVFVVAGIVIALHADTPGPLVLSLLGIVWVEIGAMNLPTPINAIKEKISNIQKDSDSAEMWTRCENAKRAVDEIYLIEKK